MSTRRHRKKEFASLMAGVFMWLIIGTLINFHQHHLFGGVLIFHISHSISLKKDEGHSAQDLDQSFDLNVLQAVLAMTEHARPSLRSSTVLALPDVLPAKCGIASLRHRGPPTT